MDLVLSSEEHLVHSMEILDVFSTSDHNMLAWQLNFGTKEKDSAVTRLDYNRADFGTIRQELKRIDWKNLLIGTTEECWNLFKTELLRLERTHVPVMETNKGRKQFG